MRLVSIKQVLLQLQPVAVAYSNRLDSLCHIFQVIGVYCVNCSTLAENPANPCEKAASCGSCLPTASFTLNPQLHFLFLSCQQLYFIGDCCSMELEARAPTLPEKAVFHTMYHFSMYRIQKTVNASLHFQHNLLHRGTVLSSSFEIGMWYFLYLKACYASVFSISYEENCIFPKLLPTSWASNFVSFEEGDELLFSRGKKTTTEKSSQQTKN